MIDDAEADKKAYYALMKEAMRRGLIEPKTPVFTKALPRNKQDTQKQMDERNAQAFKALDSEMAKRVRANYTPEEKAQRARFVAMRNAQAMALLGKEE